MVENLLGRGSRMQMHPIGKRQTHSAHVLILGELVPVIERDVLSRPILER